MALARLVGLVVVFGSCVCLAAPSAEKARAVERLAAEAAGAYKAGDFIRAAELLEKAVAIQPETPVLYNLAKAYDKLAEDEKAFDFYRRYSVARDADPKLKMRAENRMLALKASIDAVKRGAPKRNEKEAIPSETLAQPTELNPPPPPKPPPPPPDPWAEAKRKRKIYQGVGLGLASLGVAALGVGIGLGVAAMNNQNSFSASLVEADKRRFKANAQSFAAGADAMYVIGVVAVGASGYFLYRGFRPMRESDKGAWLVPAIGPQSVGVAAGGAF
jgi:hypothetical protein